MRVLGTKPLGKQGALILQVVVISSVMVILGMTLMQLLNNSNRTVNNIGTRRDQETLRAVVEQKLKDPDGMIRSEEI